jgi:transcriptional regulator
MLVPDGSKGGDVIRGTLDLLILHVLLAGPLHGWAILEQIEQRSRDLLRVNQGSLYPALYRLVREKKVKSEWRHTEANRRARYYVLTDKGRQQLREERTQWERLSKGVALVIGQEAFA